MKRTTTILLTAAISCGLLLTGCGDSHDGHDHGHGEEMHTHAEGDGHNGHDAHTDEEDHDHDEDEVERELGAVAVGGTTLSIGIGSEPVAGETVHVHIDHTAGAEPAAIRVWIGDESGAGSMKGKAVASGDTFHGDAEVPSPMAPGSALWIEVEAADGTRTKGSIAF
jgi:hypothetical protein